MAGKLTGHRHFDRLLDLLLSLIVINPLKKAKMDSNHDFRSLLSEVTLLTLYPVLIRTFSIHSIAFWLKERLMGSPVLELALCVTNWWQGSLKKVFKNRWNLWKSGPISCRWIFFHTFGGFGLQGLERPPKSALSHTQGKSYTVTILLIFKTSSTSKCHSNF